MPNPNPNANPQQVQDELTRMNQNNSTKKLTFDPQTGELILKSPNEQERPNEVVVDQIYKDGFFK